MFYAHGQGVQQDYTQAAFWYRQAAEQGDADAQNSLSAIQDKLAAIEAHKRKQLNLILLGTVGVASLAVVVLCSSAIE